MPKRRKPRSQPRPPLRLSAQQRDQYLLDAFTTTDLRQWRAIGEKQRVFEVLRYHALEALRQAYKTELIEALQNSNAEAQLNTTSWSRIVDYRYSNHPLSAAGSTKRGGRFNVGKLCDRSAAAKFAALYIAQDHETAMGERFGNPIKSRSQSLTRAELALRKTTSYTHVRIAAKFEGLFDLTKSNCLASVIAIIKDFPLPEHVVDMARELGLGTAGLVVRSQQQLKATLLAEDWRFMPSNHGLPANPQVFGTFLREAGFEGVLYKSTRSSGKCAAIFPDTLTPQASFVALADAAPKGTEHVRLDNKNWKHFV